jgi:hypothetical protein
MTERRKFFDEQIPDLVIGPASKSSRRDQSVRLLDAEPFDPRPEGLSLELGGAAGEADDNLDFDELVDRGAADLELSVAQTLRDASANSAEKWPVGVTPDPIVVGAEQLQHVVCYGDPPTHFLETPVYAMLVLRTQLRLKREASQARLRLERAEQDRDAALAVWIESVRPQLSVDERFARMLERLWSEEAAMAKAVHDLDRAKAETTRNQQAMDEVGLELKTRLDAASLQCSTQTNQLADAESTHAREQAKRKRIDIEARAGAAALDTATLSTRIAEADRAVQVALAQLELERQNLAAANRARDTILLELRQFEDRQRRLAREDARMTNDVHRGVAMTEHLLARKKADIGRAVLALREHKYIGASTIEVLLRHDAEVLGLANESRCFGQALSGFDRQAVKHGLWLAIATMAAGVLTVLTIIIVLSNIF